MLGKKKLNGIKRVKVQVLLLAIFLLPCNAQIFAATSGEVPEAVFSGADNASVMLSNLDYRDIKNTDAWSNEAIYEAGALNLMKGYGNKTFAPKRTISKEEAVATAYRIAGREADAQKAAEALDSARAAGNKKTDPTAMWADGYLQLAANEGLITQKDLTDALSADQTALADTDFHRTAPAQRQDMAYWLAKALKLQPVYDQQKIFTSYSDWSQADPVKVPYIEAVLQNNIMNGDGNGHFNPAQAVTREQTAQIAKNAESVILPLLKYEKRTGRIEAGAISNDLSTGDNIAINIFDVRNSNGKLHRITTQSGKSIADPARNERSGLPAQDPQKELVVFKNGQLGNSSLLSKGDSIEYITAPDNTVKFVRVISSKDDSKYIAAKINGIDTANMLMNVSQFFMLDTPDTGVNKGNRMLDLNGEPENATYRYSGSAWVENNNGKYDIGSLTPGTGVILTVRNNMITTVKRASFNIGDGEQGVVRGIVEDNNPQLGYITLYNEDGTGTGTQAQKQLVLFRTFNYGGPGSAEVFRNHQSAKPEDIQVGDTAFIKTDGEGNVLSISAVANYSEKYGKILSARSGRLDIRLDDGSVLPSLEVDDKTIVKAGGKLSDIGSVKDGDRVKLILQVTNKFTRIKEITVEGGENLITGIYKGRVSSVDDTSGKIALQNVESFDRGQWVKVEQKGVVSIGLSDECGIYANNGRLDPGRQDLLKGAEAYVAVSRDYGGGEKAVMIKLRNESDTEILYDDKVSASNTGAGEFNLSGEYGKIKYGEGSIVVKDGRLVLGGSISSGDTAYVVVNRNNYGDGEYHADVVRIEERPDINFAQVYRGRINQINENKDFTIESFSRLNGLLWDYYNTPKTFRITYDTDIVSGDGIVSQRDFVGYGDKSYIGRPVYVVAHDTDAMVVSTAPYGSVNARGTVYEVTGGKTGDGGIVLQEPTGFKLRLVSTYDTGSRLWNASKDMTINIIGGSVIIKNNRIAKPSDLKSGDEVRVLKKDASVTGDAYIVIVEN